MTVTETKQVVEWDEGPLTDRVVGGVGTGTTISTGMMVNDATGETAIDVRVQSAATEYAVLITQEQAMSLIRCLQKCLNDAAAGQA